MPYDEFYRGSNPSVSLVKPTEISVDRVIPSNMKNRDCGYVPMWQNGLLKIYSRLVKRTVELFPDVPIAQVAVTCNYFNKHQYDRATVFVGEPVMLPKDNWESVAGDTKDAGRHFVVGEKYIMRSDCRVVLKEPKEGYFPEGNLVCWDLG